MSRKIRDSRTRKRINPGSKTRRIDPEEVAKALGAQVVKETTQRGMDPVSFFALHRRMLSELKSTGGRPGRLGVSGCRKKVPMSDQEWNDLKQLSYLLSRLGVNASPGQVAGFLLESSLRQLMVQIKVIEAESDQVIAAAASANVPLENLGLVADELLEKLKLRKLQELIPGLDSSKEK